MRSRARSLFAIHCYTASLLFLQAERGITLAHAACVSGAHCEANGSTATETPAANSHFHATETSSAVRAVNGGTITGDALTITAPATSHQYAVSAHSGGKITLTGDTTTITGGYGVHAAGAGSVFKMTGGKIETSTRAVSMGNAANVVLTDVDIVNIHPSHSAVLLDHLTNDARFTMTGGSITTTGNEAHGIQLLGDAGHNVLTANDVTFTVSGVNAHGVSNGGSTATLINSHFVASGAGGVGIYSDSHIARRHAIVNMRGGTITITGTNGATGAAAFRGGEAHLDGVTVSTTGAGTFGLFASSGLKNYSSSLVTFKNGVIDVQGAGIGAAVVGYARVEIDNSQITTAEQNTRGLVVQRQATAKVSNGSVITAAGKGSIGLDLYGLTNEVSAIQLDDSRVSALASGATAVRALGAVNRLDAARSVLEGDLLVRVAANDHGHTGALNFNANNSVLTGRAAVSAGSTLTMNLTHGTHWRLRPSSDGVFRSDVTFLNLDHSRIVFDPASAQRQTLVVGTGDASSNPTVWRAFANAHVEMNTVLNAGGALANRSTDRLIINGDVSGTTFLTVHPVAGSTDTLAGNTASDGVSLVQVYGKAKAYAFALRDGYVPVGPYEYQLYAFAPNASDPNQRDPLGNGGPFWDFRLQSGRSLAGAPKTLLAQVPNYLVAPNALFQARLQDIGTLHRRVDSGLPDNDRNTFLRAYGGHYDYRSELSARQYGFDADTRYHAIQGGGDVFGANHADHALRVGLAGSWGDLSFQPHRASNSRKTRMDVWSISPTVTWQQTSGAYVDALLSYGGFKGNIANRKGVSTTLRGQSYAASVEAGMPFELAGLRVVPQVQTVYQRLKFARLRDADGLDVKLGSPTLWTLRAGSEIGKTLTTGAGNRIQLYGKVHLTHTPGNGKTVKMQERFRVGKFGTVAEIGLGLDAAFAKGRATIHADLTRQQRVSRAGYQGWSANVGVQVKF